MVTFYATLKRSGNAIKIDAQGEAEITFTVPESELPEVIKLTMFTGKVMKLIIHHSEERKIKRSES